MHSFFVSMSLGGIKIQLTPILCLLSKYITKYVIIFLNFDSQFYVY